MNMKIFTIFGGNQVADNAPLEGHHGMINGCSSLNVAVSL